MFGWLEETSGIFQPARRWSELGFRPTHGRSCLVFGAPKEVSAEGGVLSKLMQRAKSGYNLSDEAAATFDCLQITAVDDKSRTAADLTKFVVHFGDQTLYFSADTEKEKMIWVSLFRAFADWRRGSDEFIAIPRDIGIGMLKGMAWLAERGKTVHHVFRIDPPNEVICRLHHEIIIQGQDIADNESALVVAGLIKALLRSLPETLMTGKLFDSFLDASSSSTADPHAQVSRLVLKLPRINQRLLRNLARTFRAVIEHKEMNAMPVEALAICVGPNLMPGALSPTSLKAFMARRSDFASLFTILTSDQLLDSVNPKQTPSKSTSRTSVSSPQQGSVRKPNNTAERSALPSPSMSPNDSGRWRRQEISDSGRWRNSGLEPSDSGRRRNSGLEPNDSARWRNSAIEPSDSGRWNLSRNSAILPEQKAESKTIETLKAELSAANLRIRSLEKDLTEERSRYEELSARYDILWQENLSLAQTVRSVRRSNNIQPAPIERLTEPSRNKIIWEMRPWKHIPDSNKTSGYHSTRNTVKVTVTLTRTRARSLTDSGLSPEPADPSHLKSDTVTDSQSQS
eukprot:g16629.t1